MISYERSESTDVEPAPQSAGGLRTWWRALPPFWRFQLAGWALFAVGYTIFKAAAIANVPLAIESTFVQEPVAFALTLLLHRYYRSLPRGKFSASIALRVLAASIAAACIDMLWFSTARLLMHPEHELALPGWRGLFSVAMVRVGLFGCWSTLYFWVRAWIAHTEAQAAANFAQVQALRAQLNPHFLFNALNSIVAEADDNPRAVKGLARELAGYLRYSLAHRHSDTVPLGAELDAVQHYLNVEKARFEERLHFAFEVSAEARATPVPGFFLQPLVENAVKHGLQTSRGPMRILIRAACTEDLLRIEVGNTGEWREPAGRPGDHGFGLESIRKRIELLHPGRGSLRVDHRANQWVNVTLEIPRP